MFSLNSRRLLDFGNPVAGGFPVGRAAVRRAKPTETVSPSETRLWSRLFALVLPAPLPLRSCQASLTTVPGVPTASRYAQDLAHRGTRPITPSVHRDLLCSPPRTSSGVRPHGFYLHDYLTECATLAGSRKRPSLSAPLAPALTLPFVSLRSSPIEKFSTDIRSTTNTWLSWSFGPPLGGEARATWACAYATSITRPGNARSQHYRQKHGASKINWQRSNHTFAGGRIFVRPALISAARSGQKQSQERFWKTHCDYLADRPADRRHHGLCVRIAPLGIEESKFTDRMNLRNLPPP